MARIGHTEGLMKLLSVAQQKQLLLQVIS